jgi:hypothetical protein
MSTNAFAGWNIYKQIELRASDKNMFRLDRVSDNKIRAWFILARKAPGVFQNRFALYQVDNNPVRDLNEVKGTAANKNADQWLIWPISNSLDSPSKLLLEIINGKEITFQYYLPDGMIKESKFKLEGIKQAIEELGSARSR